MLAKNKELHELKQRFLKLLQAKHPGFAPSKKLAAWPQLSTVEFLKELEKAKLKLSLAEQGQWMDHFDTEKAKAAALQNLLAQTESEIDNMVYRLYGLTADEVKIVEGSAAADFVA